MCARQSPFLSPEKSPHRALCDPVLNALLDAIFPPRCAGCGGWSRALFCTDCTPQLRPISAPLCDICGAPFDPLAYSAPICAACRAKTPPFFAARSVWHFDGPPRRAIHRFKYAPKSALAIRLAPFLARHWEEDFVLKGFAPQFLVPVPLHPVRLRKRGFNQSLLLCRELERLTGVEARNILCRTRDTKPQVDLNRDERAKNVRGAFAIASDVRRDKPDFQGARLLLIDDVFTTGATLGEAAKTLKRAGAGEICALTLARQA